jgi:hypothetical protein
MKLSKIKLFGFFLCFGLIALIPRGFIFASAPFEDNFDLYTVGALSGQGDWTNYINQQTCAVQDSIKYNGVNGVSCQQTISSPYASNYRTTENRVPNGEWYFRVKVVPKGSTGEIGNLVFGSDYLHLTSPFNPNAGFISFFEHEGIVSANGLYGSAYDVISPGDLSLGDWNTLGIIWDCNNHTVQYVLNSVATDPVALPGAYATDACHFGGVGGVAFSNEGATSLYFDGLNETPPNPETIPGANPLFTPTFPVDGTTNNIPNILNFNITGNLSVPTDHPFSYDWICAVFQNVEDVTENWTKCLQLLPAIAPGNSYNYDFTVDEIPHDRFFAVSYKLIGHEASTGKFNSYDYVPANTYLTENTAPPASVFNPIDFGSWGFTEENCDSYDILPKLVCQIKNMLGGIFLPTAPALTSAQQTFSQFQNKFPFNYIAEVQDTMATVYDGITQEGTAIQITLFGHTEPINFSWFSGTGLGKTIQGAMVFFLILGFVFWGIDFMGRIF